MFKCEQCPMEFVYKTNLIAHRRTHLKLFKCAQCTSEFIAKRSLYAHKKTHKGIRFPCTECCITFSYKTNLKKHLKNIHGIKQAPVRQKNVRDKSQITIADNVHGAVQRGNIQIAPHIFVPDIPAGPSRLATPTVLPSRNDRSVEPPTQNDNVRDKQNTHVPTVRDKQNTRVPTVRDNITSTFYNDMDDDEVYAQVADIIEDLGYCEKEDPYTMLDNGKRVSSANTRSAVRAKKSRLNLVKSSGFQPISTSANKTITWYYVKNNDSIQNYIYFLDSIKSELFEKNNPSLSVNVYGIDMKFQPPKFPEYKVFPLKVVDEEKPNHFDLLIISDGDNSHYSYISNFSRLVRSQKTSHTEKVIFCKRCFTSFDNIHTKYKLNGEAGLEQHKLICGEHKPILAQMPAPGTMLEFTAWNKTQRHPIVIYADFEAILKKTDEEIGEKTVAFQQHKPMSYGLVVKANEDIPVELLEKFGIPT